MILGWDSFTNWHMWTQDYKPYWQPGSPVYPYPPSSQRGGSTKEKCADTETESQPSCSEGDGLDKAERDMNEVSLQSSYIRYTLEMKLMMALILSSGSPVPSENQIINPCKKSDLIV